MEHRGALNQNHAAVAMLVSISLTLGYCNVENQTESVNYLVVPLLLSATTPREGRPEWVSFEIPEESRRPRESTLDPTI